jgi:hypothetical protein
MYYKNIFFKKIIFKIYGWKRFKTIKKIKEKYLDSCKSTSKYKQILFLVYYHHLSYKTTKKLKKKI